MRSLVPRLAAFALATLISVAAAAEPAPLSEALSGEAKAAYEGGKLLYGDGDFAGARVKFQAAYEAAKDPRLLWNVAVCEKGLRHYAKVVELTKKYLETSSDLITEADRTEAKELLNAIESFTVELTLAINEPEAEIWIDGERVGSSPLAGPIVVDIGTREIGVQKSGFTPFRGSVPVGGQKQASLTVKLERELHEGTLSVNAPKGGTILIDGKVVGSGRWTGKLASGGHTLRVEAQGMRPYQSEVVIQDNDKRGVDVVLDPIVTAAPPPEQHGPLYDMEVGFRAGYGVAKRKARGYTDSDYQDLSVGYIPLWVDIGYRLGRPTYLGIYAQYGWLDKSETCGIARHGAEPTYADDANERFGYTSCKMIKAGVSMVFHVMPRTIVDPYFGFDLGVQGTFTQYRSYDPLSGREREGSDDNGSFQPGFQLGVDLHPISSLGVGLFGHVGPDIGGEGQAHENGENQSVACPVGSNCTPAGNPCGNGSCTSESKVGWHMMLGTRVAYTFP
jgi:PEGA domain